MYMYHILPLALYIPTLSLYLIHMYIPQCSFTLMHVITHVGGIITGCGNLTLCVTIDMEPNINVIHSSICCVEHPTHYLCALFVHVLDSSVKASLLFWPLPPTPPTL